MQVSFTGALDDGRAHSHRSRKGGWTLARAEEPNGEADRHAAFELSCARPRNTAPTR